VDVPVLAPLRVRVPCSLARIGASNAPRDQADGVSDEPIALPPENPDTAPLPDPLDPDEDELDPPSPRDTAEPPPLSPPREADCPVVLPLEVRSCAAAGSPAALTPRARTRVPNNF
jgi:hypothetical protein